jgi:hypothetical protein
VVQAVTQAVTQAATQLRIDGSELDVSVASDQATFVPGTELGVTWRLRVRSGRLYVAVGGDRATGRLAGFTFTGRVPGTDLELRDPAAGSVDIGGPIGSHEVADDFSVPLPVGDFLTLDAIPPGTAGVLELGCGWQLRAGSAGTVLSAPAVPVELTLRIPLA